MAANIDLHTPAITTLLICCKQVSRTKLRFIQSFAFRYSNIESWRLLLNDLWLVCDSSTVVAAQSRGRAPFPHNSFPRTAFPCSAIPRRAFPHNSPTGYSRLDTVSSQFFSNFALQIVIQLCRKRTIHIIVLSWNTTLYLHTMRQWVHTCTYYRPITLINCRVSFSGRSGTSGHFDGSRPVFRISSLCEPFSYKLSFITEFVMSR